MAGPIIFVTGTKTFIQGTTAPTGWTKDTSSYSSHALRVVSGTATPGGTVDFTTIFAPTQPVTGSSSHNVTGSAGATTLSIPQIAGHGHPSIFAVNVKADAVLVPVSTTPSTASVNPSSPLQGVSQSGPTLGGGSHTHSWTDTAVGTVSNFPIAIKYVDIILVTKN